MNYNPYSLNGLDILVTGASSGIGRATAIECSKLGARVIITARNEAKLKETLSMMEGSDHKIFVCDLTNQDQLTALVDVLPVVHGIVNNAGISAILPVQFIKEEIFSNMMNTNAIAPIILLQRILKKKKISKGGSVVFTSSVAATGAVTPGNSMYVATKGAITSFVRCAALELASKKIRVNAICPGMTNTPLIRSGNITEEQLKNDEMSYPLGRYAQPEEIAWGIVYLLSNASSWVTGINLIIDGGLTIRS